MRRDKFGAQFAVLMVFAILTTTLAAAHSIPTLMGQPKSIVVEDPEPISTNPIATVQESIWCDVTGWYFWRWGVCPSWIPIPKKLQPILQPDGPTCDIYGPCQG